MGYFRAPRTMNEQRAAEAHVVDGLKVRGRRKAHNLPDSYDDIGVAAWFNRNWKRFRKTRWREAS